MDPNGESQAARVAVIIPCHGEGPLIAEAVESIREDEPVEVVVVDDASLDAPTRTVLDELEAAGTHVIRLPSNQGVAIARMRGYVATRARYVLPLDADDLAIPGLLAEMADRLDADPGAAACLGDIEEFGDHAIVRAVPERLDPYRVAYTNEYPITALFRRSVLDEVGGWRRFHNQQGYEDWNLWMALAERGERVVHLGAGRPSYRRRLHGRRLNADAKTRHRRIYHALQQAHPRLFAELPEHRRNSDLGVVRKRLYPVVYGARPSVPFERTLKPWFDRLGIWTLRRR